jgi:biopolymer transport protein ExbD
MDLRRALGLALAAVVLALVVWGLMFTVRIDFPPAAKAKPPQARPVTVSIDETGALSIDGRRSSLDTLDRDLSAWAPDKDRTVILHATDDLPYKTVMPVMRKLEATGRYKVGLISEDGLR